MEGSLSPLDWSRVQCFLAVAETGSLSAAARHLGQSQPTVGRHIAALEKQLDRHLFQRHTRGLNLTEAGEKLLPHARAAERGMRALSLAAAGQETSLDGTVRITASEFASFHILPPILAAMRAAEPGIEIELAPTDTTENLLFREADIAVRMHRPTQLDIVTRHVGDLEIACFAAKSYVARKSIPLTPERLLEHDIVGLDRNDLIIRSMRDFGIDVTRNDFAVRCDNQIVHWELVRAGCGIGFTQAHVGRCEEGIVEMSLGAPLPPLPVWLAAPAALRETPRLRRAWDLLGKGLDAYVRRGVVDAPAPAR